MSNRYAQGRQGGSKSFTKTQRKYMPKNQIIAFDESPNPNPTLSNSLREPIYKQSDAATENSSSAVSMRRVQMGANGVWVSSKANDGNFVNYLPQDEAVASGLPADEGGLDPVESQKVVDLLNRELSRLLKLSAKEFWREVARDTSLHEFLDSFLKFRSRWYDFPHRGVKGIVAGVIVGEFELSRRVFMVLYRISSNREPCARAADSLSAKDHEVFLQEKKLLDLPKLFDICAICGHENEELTRVMVGNAMKSQPNIHDNLTPVVSHFLTIVQTMHQRCNTSLEALLSSGSNRDSGFNQLLTDFLEVIDFINDAIVSLDAFVSAYNPAAIFFLCPVDTSFENEDLLGTVARLHDSLLPSLQQGFRILLKSRKDEMISNIAISLKMLSSRMIKFGWKLLDFCYLGDEVFNNEFPIPTSTKMFLASVEDPLIRADILVQTLREINGASQQVQENHPSTTFIQKVEKDFHIMDRIETLRSSGWIHMDEEQFGYISGMLMYSPKAIIKVPSSVAAPLTSNKAQMDDDAVIMQSKISQIKDLFPDYGNGFLAACLEAYNQSPEEVIQRILEGTLHADLQSLNTSLEAMPPPPSTSTIVNVKDKGKGKLVESPTIAASTNSVPISRDQQTKVTIVSSSSSTMVKSQMVPSSSSSSSTIGRYTRKSKDEASDADILNKKKEIDLERTTALLSQYEYEDEYDDSFDDLGLSIAETGGEENEILGDRLGSKSNNSWATDTRAPKNLSSSSKWGSRKQPQFYVKDGKNYSYKVAGSVAVANYNEASLVSQAQEELIYGLGKGGNFPLGAVKKLTEQVKEQDDQSAVSEVGERVPTGSGGRGKRQGGIQRNSLEGQDKQLGVSEVGVRGNVDNYRTRGRGGGRRSTEAQEGQDKQSDVSETESRGNAGNYRGRGRRGGGRNNNYRKDRAMNKHFSGLTGH